MYDPEYQHRSRLPTQGLREARAVSKGHKLAQTRQVGNMSADSVPTAGMEMIVVVLIWQLVCDLWFKYAFKIRENVTTATGVHI